MDNQEINHAAGLVKSLRAKATLLRQQAADLDHDKEGRSRYADRLREEADNLIGKAEDLKAAVDAQLWLER